MASTLSRILHSKGLFARVLRSSGWIAVGFGGAQLIRLASNLILTRLLFPEAFGVMAIIMVLMQGLNNFSDVGITPSILQSRRGDEPGFLNTAWTMQALRGAGLWLATCVLAWPVALFYDEPMLAWYLPVAGLSLLVAGFNPTRIETANRHLMFGRLTQLDLLSAFLSTAVTVALAAVFPSVWALVAGLVAGAVIRLVLTARFLPGAPNRLRWEPDAARELFTFGRWVFLSTIAGFALAQGDKAILGKYLTLEQLGIYNIGFFLASFPLMFAQALTSRLMIPLYRERPPGAARDNYLRLRRVRMGLGAAVLALLAVVALAGVPLVGLLYDDRYAVAGAICVLIACALAPQVVGLGYDQAALAGGDSYRFFLYVALRAAVFVALFLTGAMHGGLVGALAGQALASVVTYPALAVLARRHGAWDGRSDLVLAAAALAIAAAALAVNRAEIAALIGGGG